MAQSSLAPNSEFPKRIRFLEEKQLFFFSTIEHLRWTEELIFGDFDLDPNMGVDLKAFHGGFESEFLVFFKNFNVPLSKRSRINLCE